MSSAHPGPQPVGATDAVVRFTRRVLDNLFAFVGVLLPDGTLVEANRAPLEAAGLTLDDVLGRAFWACPWWTHDPAVEDRVRDAVERAARGEASRFDVQIRTVGDGRAWIDFQLAPLLDDHGVVTHLVPSAIGIDDRRATEERVRNSEALLRTVFAALDEGFAVCEVIHGADGRPVDYRFLDVNPVFEDITGLHQPVGRTVSEMLPGPEPLWLDVLADVALGGSPRRFEQRSATMGKDVDVFAMPVAPRGRFALVCRDVTERRTAERLVRRNAAADAYRVALTDALRLTPSPLEAATAAMRLLAAHLGTDRAVWAELGEGGLEVVAEHVAGAVPSLLGVPVGAATFDEALQGRLTQGDVVVAGDARGADADAALALGVVAQVSVPLVQQRAVVAVLGVHQCHARAWTPAEVAMVHETAERVWSSLERTRSQAAERRARERAEMLAELVGEVAHERTVVSRAARLLEVLVPRVAGGAELTVHAAGVPLARVQRRPPTSPVSPPATASVVHLAVGEVRGVLVLHGPLLDAPRAFWDEVAARAALLLENARLLELEHAIALRLQRALLPERLVQQEHLGVGARYAAGSDGLEVGGDWYDSHQLADGRVVLTVGDVVGHGLDAAAAMGRLRTALGTLVAHVEGPGQLLERLDEYAAKEGVDFATACVVELDPLTGVLRFASAGHPPALVVFPDGTTTFLTDGRGPPVFGSGAVRSHAVAVLPPGSRLVLYSDGLVERRGESLDDGLGRLRVAAVAARHLDADGLCGAVVDALQRHPVPGDDDVVVLCAQLPAVRPVLHVTVPANPGALVRVRAAVRRWLDGHGMPETVQVDVQLAVGEACANAVEHGFAHGGTGTVELTLVRRATEHRLAVEVRDTGTWRDRIPGPDRGRGTAIMQAIGERFERVTGPAGTTVAFELPWPIPAVAR